MSRPVIILDGPDACGKTEISTALSAYTSIPRFKVSTEKENWYAKTFKNSLAFDMLLPQFIAATNTGVIFDRSYPSEWVYSKVFKRETDFKALRHIDDAFTSINAFIMILLRRDYSKSREDELVPSDKLQELNDTYLEFADWTSCRKLVMYVDEYNNDLNLQVPALIKGMYERLSEPK